MEYHRRFTNSIQSIDNKAVAMLAVVSLALSLFLSAAGRMSSEISDLLVVSAPPSVALAMLICGVVFFLAGAFCAFRALWVRGFHDGPSVQALLDNYWNADQEDLQYNILWWAYQWEESNAGLLETKSTWLRRSMMFAIVEVLFLVAWFVVS